MTAAVRDTAAPEPDTTGATGAADRVREALARPETTMFLVLLGIVLVFSVLDPGSFPTLANAQGILSDAAILLVLAVGATYVVITAGIDLSVGSVLVFSSVVGAKAMEAVGGSAGRSVPVGLLVAVACGAAWGAINGTLVARARIPAFVVTLGTLGAAYGTALVISDGIDVRGVPAPLVEFGSRRVGGVPAIALTAIVIAVVAGVVLARTVFGRHTYAIGSNPESARRAGIDVERQLVKVYTIAGVLAGVGAFLSLARYGTTTISGNTTTNLQVITAVVIGGTSLFGGIGRMFGTAVGVLIPIVLANGFIVRGVNPYWQYVAVGAVLVLAVFVDQRRRSRRLT